MIAVDTSSFVGFLAGEDSADVDLITQAIEGELLILPPVVISELFSARNLSDDIKNIIKALPQLDIKDGFWVRVGEARAKILATGKKARLADTMIAVFCLDHDIPLIARDKDYRHFVAPFGLRLLPAPV